MVSNTSGYRPVRALVVLGIAIAVLFGTVAAGVKWSNATVTPKLALDLEGGTQIILTPIADSGAEISDAMITESINIIRQRIDASGVSEAQITSQGGGQGGTSIVVGIPGKPDQATLDLVRKSAQMRFRPVLLASSGNATTAEASPSASPTASASASATTTAKATATAKASATPSASPSASPTASPTAIPTNQPTTVPSPEPTAPSDPTWLSPAVMASFDGIDCTNPENRTGGGADDPDLPLVACSPQGDAKYVLGPVEIEGKEIANANSGPGTGPNGVVTSEWVVNLKFNGTGAEQFAKVTKRMYGAAEPYNRFAVVLDGLVITAPSVNAEIPNGQAEISGSFTRVSAATLASQLSFGSLPLAYKVLSEEQISATLGAEQLQRGLLAGLIGLILVVLYSLLQYRGLGLVTVASLAIAALITYGVITLLSWTQGYRLSLPGVAGVIVSIGITADSFIVFFERVRDELREGRGLSAAVEHGWERARRTILAADGVNFLAAVVLYFLAVGGVRGFAYTLGLTTLVDLLVVFLFTHPVLRLLARTPFFADGHRLSGLDPARLGVPGARYRGRGQVAMPAAAGPASAVPAEFEQLTIAERRAAATRAAKKSGAAGAASSTSKGSDD